MSPEKVIGNFIPESVAVKQFGSWTEYERGKVALFEIQHSTLPPEYVVLFIDYLPYWDFIDNYIMGISGGRACVGWYKADGSGLTGNAETWSTYVDENGDKFYLAKVVQLHYPAYVCYIVTILFRTNSKPLGGKNEQTCNRHCR